jgi:E3 ubiquitin-protein ligase EDD1
MKYILGRPIRFHDLAFFDPVIYESLRQLVVDAETKDSNSLFSALDLTFRYVFQMLHCMLEVHIYVSLQ